MTRLVSALACVFVLAACDSAVESPGRNLSPEEGGAVRQDAAVLAFRYQLDVQHDSDTVALPRSVMDGLTRAITAVRTSDRADLVAGIHTFPVLSPTMVYVVAGADAAWADAWANQSATTGYEPVDALVEAYELTWKRFWATSYGKTVILGTGTPLNTVALSRRFGAVEGVRYAGPDGFIGDGDNIEARRDGDAWVLTFSAGSGDCQAGCINRKYWTFRIYDDGDVTYLGAR